MRNTILCLALLAVSGCTRLHLDWEVDPARVGRPPATWAFEAPPSPQEVGPLSPSTPEGAALLVSIAREFEARGYRQVERESAEVWVRYYAAIEQSIDLRAPEYHHWRRFEEGVALGPGIMAEGTLVIEVVDPAAERVIFQGVATRSTERVEALGDRVDDVVGRLVAAFSEGVRRR